MSVFCVLILHGSRKSLGALQTPEQRRAIKSKLDDLLVSITRHNQ